MPTALDIITQAMRKIGVLEASETPEADMSQDALDDLNKLLFDLVPEGADIGFRAALAIGDTIPTPPELDRALMYMLAAEIAPDYGSQVASQQINMRALAGRQKFQNWYHETTDLKADRGLEDRQRPFYGNRENV